MLKLILAAILLVSPHVGKVRATRYARHIAKWSKHYRVDPLLVVSLIQHETGFKNVRGLCKNCRGDWGLMQLHVSKTSHAKYLGREYLLLDPALNIKLGIRLMSWWRAQHRRMCRRIKNHWWIDHYKFGWRVPRRHRWVKLRVIYSRLTSACAYEPDRS